MKMMKTQNEIYSSLISRLERVYNCQNINGKKCFLRPGGGLFAVDQILSFGAVVVEYADNAIAAELNRYEDGDLHYLDEQDEEMLFQSIIREVEEQKEPPQD